ncbi:MAG: hypothetical protein FWF46_07385 [Oscillospiraceae bacterium]|nr:hypothetical protein [Oscillospiraceae bacterium]
MKIKSELHITTPSHAYLLVGHDGGEQLQVAKGYAKSWLCNSKDNKPCGTCKSCIQFNSNAHPDFEVIEPEGNSIKIEQARHLIDKMLEKPIESEKKIFIINEADKMTPQAQNCLLKVLEEPPEYGIIILVSSNEHVFLNTIKSRCIRMYIGKQDVGVGVLDDPNVGPIEQIINSIEQIKKVEINKLSKILLEKKENLKECLEYINTIMYKNIVGADSISAQEISVQGISARETSAQGLLRPK